MSFCDQGTLEQGIRQGRFTNNLVRRTRLAPKPCSLLCAGKVCCLNAARRHLVYSARCRTMLSACLRRWLWAGCRAAALAVDLLGPCVCVGPIRIWPQCSGGLAIRTHIVWPSGHGADASAVECVQTAILLCLLDIAAGMDYLHSLGILHSDLKARCNPLL